MQYRIVTGSTTTELEKNVKTYIEMGLADNKLVSKIANDILKD